MPIEVSRQNCPSPHSVTNRLGRTAWAFLSGMLAWSPRRCFALRAWCLTVFGASLETRTHVYPTCRIWAPWNLTLGEAACLGDRVDCYCVARIKIGSHAVISQDVKLCSATHDHNDPEFPLVSKPIVIGDHAWIAAGAFVGPGVTIGEGAVVGAHAVVFRDVAPWTIVVGNPASVVGTRCRHAASSNDDRESVVS